MRRGLKSLSSRGASIQYVCLSAKSAHSARKTFLHPKPYELILSNILHRKLHPLPLPPINRTRIPLQPPPTRLARPPLKQHIPSLAASHIKLQMTIISKARSGTHRPKIQPGNTQPQQLSRLDRRIRRNRYSSAIENIAQLRRIVARGSEGGEFVGRGDEVGVRGKLEGGESYGSGLFDRGGDVGGERFEGAGFGGGEGLVEIVLGAVADGGILEWYVNEDVGLPELGKGDLLLHLQDWHN